MTEHDDREFEHAVGEFEAVAMAVNALVEFSAAVAQAGVEMMAAFVACSKIWSDERQEGDE